MYGFAVDVCDASHKRPVWSNEPVIQNGAATDAVELTPGAITGVPVGAQIAKSPPATPAPCTVVPCAGDIPTKGALAAVALLRAYLL
jgi:hypothetical protein